jgi:hypothetical protein
MTGPLSRETCHFIDHSMSADDDFSASCTQEDKVLLPDILPSLVFELPRMHSISIDRDDIQSIRIARVTAISQCRCFSWRNWTYRYCACDTKTWLACPADHCHTIENTGHGACGFHFMGFISQIIGPCRPAMQVTMCACKGCQLAQQVAVHDARVCAV